MRCMSAMNLGANEAAIQKLHREVTTITGFNISINSSITFPSTAVVRLWLALSTALT